MKTKKVRPCEDWDFLPKEVQESTKLSTSEKNVLATLCYQYLSHSIYASKNNNWFFCSQKAIEEGSDLSHAQVNRNLLRLQIKKDIEVKSGTNHKCSHYRLCKEILELLPKNPQKDDEEEELYEAEAPNNNVEDDEEYQSPKPQEFNANEYIKHIQEEIKECYTDEELKMTVERLAYGIPSSLEKKIFEEVREELIQTRNRRRFMIHSGQVKRKMRH